jgi:hypothetical protein
MKRTFLILVVILVAFLGFVLFGRTHKTGFVKLDEPGVTLNLKPTGFLRRTVSIGPSTEQIKITTGAFFPTYGYIKKSTNGDTWRVDFTSPQNSRSLINITENQTTNLKFGPPLTVRTNVNRNGRNASIGFSIIGRAGEIYFPKVSKNGKSLGAPGVKIVDESGNILASGKFEYG